MSRGGRGGNFGGRPRVPHLPFEVDPELAEAVDRAEGENGSDDDDFQKDLFPDLTEYITSRPITDTERRSVQLEREIQAKRRAGPFWTGTREDWAQIDAATGDAGGFNAFDAFEGAQTYGKKRRRKPFKLANLKRVKVCYPQFLPKELKDVVTDTSTGNAPGERKQILGLAKQSVVDRLTNLGNDDAEAGTDGEADSDDGSDKDDDDDGIENRPEDNDFSSDEEDEDDDYNAERYFDDGEDDADDYGGGGDDYGNDE